MHKTPDDRHNILQAFRNFRKYMIRFENIALQIRAFNEGDSEIEILSKEME